MPRRVFPQDDGHTEGRTQRYREAVEKLKAAVEHWSRCKETLSFVLNLGDIINGNSTSPVESCS